MQSLGQALASFPSPSHTAEDGGHVDWEGADFAISDICDTLRVMRAEASLLKCALSLFSSPASLRPCVLSAQGPSLLSPSFALDILPALVGYPCTHDAWHCRSWQSTLHRSQPLLS